MPAGVITQCDRAMLAAFCQAWADYHEATVKLRKHPKTFTTESGYEQQSAWVSIKKQAAEQMRHFAAELGLSPSARVRLGGLGQSDGDDGGDSFEAFLQSG